MRIAVPRGSLFRETLDLLDGLGFDTSEVRANDRKLLFEDAGLITMRPSDVPTYVEAGAADLGVPAGIYAPAVTLAIAKKPGTNAVVIADALERRLAALEGVLIPEGVHATLTRNYGTTADDKARTLIGKHAMALLLELLSDGKPAETEILLRPDLIVRNSVAAPSRQWTKR